MRKTIRTFQSMAELYGAVQCQWLSGVKLARMRPAEADGDATTVLHVRRARLSY